MSETLPRIGILGRILLNWSSKRNRRELEKFIGVLAEMSIDQIAEILLCVAMIRRGMEDKGLHPLEPSNLVMFEAPGILTALAIQSQQFSRRGALIPAIACSVWGHTFRAVFDPNLKAGAKLLWRELQRGELRLFEAEDRVRIRDGVDANAIGAYVVPTGFE